MNTSLAETIIPNSNQLNADDLITGPRTIKITSVEIKSPPQPVTIHYEGENGHPYKPSLSMRRVLIVAWGVEKEAYIGRRITLFRNPLIRFGGDAVGGIQISHMSHIEKAFSVALTESKGKRKQYTVEPLAVEADPIEERGNAEAAKGVEALKAFWLTLSPSSQKHYKDKLDNTWKPIAEKVGAA